MALPRGDGWVDWTQGYRYESIGPSKRFPTVLCTTTGKPKNLLWNAILVLAAFFAVGLWAGGRIFKPGIPSETGLSPGMMSAAGEESWRDAAGSAGQHSSLMQVNVTNKYNSSSSSVTASEEAWMYPWEHIAEPSRETWLDVTTSWPESAGGALIFRWEIEGKPVGDGTRISTFFGPPGQYKCSVTAYRHAAEVQARASQIEGGPSTMLSSEIPDLAVSTLDFLVTVKYVRREIRTLTDRDRETFFNAVSVMQRVPSAVGRAIYGKKYYSKDYFNRMHLYYGGRRDCDHWHGGAGFVTSHIALSLMFEQSLQAINPSIALPYWDFTVEGTIYDGSNFRQSGVFADDWFGAAAPDNELRTPDRGRFAYVPSMVDAVEYSEVYNAYGMLRSPWNTDPNPFLTRHDHVLGFTNNRKPSGCKQYRDAIKRKSWMALTVSMNDGAHGHIHELLGGTWSAEADLYGKATSGIVKPFVHMGVPLLKHLWRARYMECPEECSLDMPWEECQCTCSAAATEGKTPATILEEAGVLSDGIFYDEDATLIESLTDEEGHAFEVIPGYSKEATERIYAEMLHTLCIPMRFGTHYEGASTNDVTFWLLHPTFDRLWHLARLQPNPHFNETWISDCSCYGHNEDDIQPFHDVFSATLAVRAGEDGLESEAESTKSYYTNAELYSMMKPDSTSGPYIYDNFEWTHCDTQGVRIHGYAGDAT